MYPELKLYIAGKWRKATSDMPVVNPATEEEIGRLPCATKSDLDDALEAAVKAFRVWGRTSHVNARILSCGPQHSCANAKKISRTPSRWNTASHCLKRG